MKYYLTAILAILSLSMNLASCNPDDPIPEIEQPILPGNPDDSPGNDDRPGESDGNDTPDHSGDNNENDNHLMSNNLKISIGSVSFNATLENNATVTAFKALLPMTVHMSEMNGNEKYYYLPGKLVTSPYNPKTIHAGDLMLYGSSCVVLFYKTLSSSYNYTRLGSVDAPSELTSALGSGRANVTFELQNRP